MTVGLVGLPDSTPKPGLPLPPMESSTPLARSRQQLQQSRPMGDRHSSSDISETLEDGFGTGAQVEECNWMNLQDLSPVKCCQGSFNLSMSLPELPFQCFDSLFQAGRCTAAAVAVATVASSK